MKKLSYPAGYIILINRYLSERNQRCFTYRGLRSWIYKQPEYRDVEWHTVERTIRKLVEDGYLDRIEIKRNQVLFCINDKFKRALSAVMRSIYGDERFR